MYKQRQTMYKEEVMWFNLELRRKIQKQHNWLQLQSPSQKIQFTLLYTRYPPAIPPMQLDQSTTSGSSTPQTHSYRQQPPLTTLD